MIRDLEHNVNRFAGVSNLPYNIIQYLFANENIWKLIKYASPDALSQPVLTAQEKAALIWKGEDNQENFRIYLTPMQENIQYTQSAIMRLYLLSGRPRNDILSTLTYTLEILCQTKLGMLDNGIPRMDLLFELIMGELMGKQVDGIGEIFFNADSAANSQCKIQLNSENNRNYMGYAISLGVHYSDVKSQ